jgi:nucleoside-diphosphate-sugar epimerase
MTKKILVAGGGGYVGTSLAPALAARGHDVKVADLFWFGNHLPHEIATEKHDFFSLTPDDLSGFDVLVFLAGLSNDPMAAFSPRMNFIANTAGPVFLAHQAKTAGVRRFIHGGTCSVYGFADNTAMNEDSPTMPAFPYGVSKLAGERGVLALADDKFEVVGFRKGTVCGHSPRMRFDLVVNAMVKDAFTKGAIAVDDPALWRPILSVDDCVHAYIQATEGDSGQQGIFNVGSVNIQIGALATQVALVLTDEYGLRPDVITLGRANPRSYRVSWHRASAILGYTPFDGIAEIVRSIADRIKIYGDLEDRTYYNIRTFKHLGVGA